MLRRIMDDPYGISPWFFGGLISFLVFAVVVGTYLHLRSPRPNATVVTPTGIYRDCHVRYCGRYGI